MSRETEKSLTPIEVQCKRPFGTRTTEERGGYRRSAALTIEFLENALHGAGAAAAGHLDVELVVMFRHGGCRGLKRERRCEPAETLVCGYSWRNTATGGC